MKRDAYPDVVLLIVCMIGFLFIFSEVSQRLFPSWRRIDLLADLRTQVINEEKQPIAATVDTLLTAVRPDTLHTSDTINHPTSPSENKNTGEMIVDFSPEQRNLTLLEERLQQCRSEGNSMRFAFVGDSFIEGDILTGEFRELMQSQFGGGGVGYMPMASKVSSYRRTIRQQSSGWTIHSVENGRQIGASQTLLFGSYYIPAEGASTSFQINKEYRHAGQFNTTRLLFVNRGKAVINITFNDGQEQRFEPITSDRLQSIELKGDFQSIRYAFSQVEGLVCYGTYLTTDQGVSIDNLALRGSSGSWLSRLNYDLTRQADSIVPYDAIVIQFGLNVLYPDDSGYMIYKDQMVRAVNRIKQCYPRSQIIVMGIGDRAERTERGIQTMRHVPALIRAQRQIAAETQSIYWDTFQAMGGKNSIVEYASQNPPLANKDFTHITHAGGNRLARIFYDSLMKIVL